MTFEDHVKSDIEKKYDNMLTGTTPSPFEKSLDLTSQNSYKIRRNDYINRLKLEKDEYNSALEKTQEHRAIRLVHEERERKYQEEQDRKQKEQERQRLETLRRAAEEKKEKNAYTFWKLKRFIKTAIFLLPIIITIILGLDILDRSHGHIGKMQMNNFPLWTIILIYIVLCLISLTISLSLIIKMYRNEVYINRNSIRNKRKYNILAGIVFILVASIIIFNIVLVLPTLNKNKVTFIMNDIITVEYIEKDAKITLPKTSVEKEDLILDTYKIKYVFEGWLINEKIYEPNQPYSPKENQVIVAKYKEEKWATISFFINGRMNKVTITYDDKIMTFESSSSIKKLELPCGTKVTISKFEQPGMQWPIMVDGNYKNIPYAFVLEENLTIRD